MTAVQNFTGLAELRTTSVEEKGVLCVRGRRHDIMHDAFDDIPQRDTFKNSLPVTCFNSPRGSSNRACSVTNVNEPRIIEVSKRTYRFCMCCQRMPLKYSRPETWLQRQFRRVGSG